MSNKQRTHPNVDLGDADRKVGDNIVNTIFYLFFLISCSQILFSMTIAYDFFLLSTNQFCSPAHGQFGSGYEISMGQLAIVRNSSMKRCSIGYCPFENIVTTLAK